MLENTPYIECGPLPVTATTRIVSLLVRGSRNKPSLAILGEGHTQTLHGWYAISQPTHIFFFGGTSATYRHSVVTSETVQPLGPQNLVVDPTPHVSVLSIV